MKNMIDFIKKLFYKCEHKWVVFKEIQIWGDGFGNKTDYPVGRKYVLRCEKCGDMKIIRT